MKRLLFLVGIVICAGLTLGQNSAPAPRALIDQYCVTCHNQKTRTAGLMLDKMDPAHATQDAEAWEKVVRKLRAGMMPPQGMPRPNAATYETLTVALETELDRAAAAKPKLTAPGVHRLNRTEYANAIRELVGLEIDPAVYLPADDSSLIFSRMMRLLQLRQLQTCSPRARRSARTDSMPFLSMVRSPALLTLRLIQRFSLSTQKRRR